MAFSIFLVTGLWSTLAHAAAEPAWAAPVIEATWELRFGPRNRFRVFYAVSHERRQVRILAIGTKDRNRLMIGREEIER